MATQVEEDILGSHLVCLSESSLLNGEKIHKIWGGVRGEATVRESLHTEEIADI